MKLTNLDKVVLILYIKNKPLTIKEIHRISRGMGNLTIRQIRNAIHGDRYEYGTNSYFKKLQSKREYMIGYKLSKEGIRRAMELTD